MEHFLGSQTVKYFLCWGNARTINLKFEDNKHFPQNHAWNLKQRLLKRPCVLCFLLLSEIRSLNGGIFTENMTR